MRESSASDMDKFMEDSWNDGLSINFEIHASLLSQSQQFFQHKSSRFFKNWVDTGMDQSGVALSILLSNQDLILNVEMRNVVFQVYVFGDHKSTDAIITDFGYETIVGGCWVDCAVIKHLIHFLLLIQCRDEFFNILQFFRGDSLDIHILIE
jgi:hypothetical protein